jgi:hypothetical protein
LFSSEYAHVRVGFSDYRSFWYRDLDISQRWFNNFSIMIISRRMQFIMSRNLDRITYLYRIKLMLDFSATLILRVEFA